MANQPHVTSVLVPLMLWYLHFAYSSHSTIYYYTLIHNVSSTNFTGYATLQVDLSEYWRIKGEEMAWSQSFDGGQVPEIAWFGTPPHQNIHSPLTMLQKKSGKDPKHKATWLSYWPKSKFFTTVFFFFFPFILHCGIPYVRE